MGKTIRVKLIKRIAVGGVLQKVGTVHDLDERNAMEQIRMGRAVAVAFPKGKK